ncbi:hypothetical protein P3342_010413 [Pyrenophora teres f. teres]|uniref:Uncharacterized protein n=1 Tax=Pyrenophora teres f. teres TaxID=97479 RepID=A0A6S6WAY7_9PLEO|nr:hypothetical protein PTNB29_07072 [Pyrenophora teres f. teres]KAK1914424.1 hypothetical protein P3342_010413 [Pyrenophora teres f. teres]CAE7200251.1 hypothetical protein PTTW11_08616 [Pyrenophora teres f. teres]
MQDDAVDQNWPYNSLALFSNSPVTEQPYPMQQTLADHPKGKAICLLCHAIIYAKMRYTFAAVPFWDFREHFQSDCLAQPGIRTMPGAVWSHEDDTWTVLDHDPVVGNAKAEEFAKQPFQTSGPFVRENSYKEEYGRPVQQRFHTSKSSSSDAHKERTDYLKDYLACNLDGWFPERGRWTKHGAAPFKRLMIHSDEKVELLGWEFANLPTEKAAALHIVPKPHALHCRQLPSVEMASCMYCGQMVRENGAGDGLMQHLVSGCVGFKLRRC